MSKYWILIGSIFFVSFCVLGNTAFAEKMNLKDTGFEIDTNRDGIPDRWSVEGKKRFVSLDKKTLHNGRYSLKISASDTPTEAYQFIPHDGKTKLYKISIWMKTDLEDTIKAHVGADYYTKDGKFLKEALPRYLRTGLILGYGKTDWKKYVIYFGRGIPQKTAKIKVWCGVNTWKMPDAKGRVWFDDIKLEAVEPNPKWPAGYPPTQWKPIKLPSYSKKVRDSGYIVFSSLQIHNGFTNKEVMMMSERQFVFRGG